MFVVLLISLPLLNSFGYDEGDFTKKLNGLTSSDNVIVLAEVNSGKIIGYNNKNSLKRSFTIGSVAKIITSIALLEENLASGKEIITCRGKEKIVDKRITCWKPSGHGRLNMEAALAESCNLFFYKMSLKITPEDILKYYKLLYLIPENSNYRPNSSYETALGLDRHISLNPLQLLSLANIIANNGIYKPVLFNNNSENRSIKKALGIKSSTISIIKNGMIKAGRYGTAKVLYHDGFSVAIKTGTAPNDDNSTHGIAIGFAPAINPKISFCIFVKKGTGFSNAVPLVEKVLKLCREYHYL